MNTIITAIKSLNLFITLTFLLLILLLLILGDIVGLVLNERILISSLLFLVWVILVLVFYMKSIQSSGQIEQSIRAQAEMQMQSTRPEKKGEIEQFKKQLEEAIDSLKKSKLGKGYIGRSALYALPWYMVIGPPAAGKTTAIQNSGLEFPFGNDGVKGVGGTRNCDWFFSNKAIFLDTAGRYTTEEEDKEEWISFLEVLKKNRKKKPINGIILGINIDEIINANEEELTNHSKNLRQRIDELIGYFGLCVPVYLLFTKCDLIKGFVEFFSDFDQSQRDQVWGCTFCKSEIDNINIKEKFKEEFHKLFDVLLKRRKERLSFPLKREQRQQVYLFPYQFQSIANKLSNFANKLFQQNPYQDNPIFRGFYFSSGTQEGAPLDIAIKRIAEQFGLVAKDGESESVAVETKNYFIRDLFNKIVIPDQYLSSSPTSQRSKQQKYFRFAMLGGITLFISLFTIGIFNEYFSGKEQLDTINTKIELVNEINWESGILENIKKTDLIREEIERIEENEAGVGFIGLGLNRGEDVVGQLKELYFYKMDRLFNQYIYDKITKRLNDFILGEDSKTEEMYSWLKAYLLIDSEKSRLDEYNSVFLEDKLISLLEADIIQYVTNAGAREELKEYLSRYISFYVKNIGKGCVKPVKNDSSLIGRVRSLLRQSPSVEGIYERMKNTATAEMNEAITLQQMLGTKYKPFMNSDYSIPGLFTLEGWESQIQNLIEEESEDPGKEDWVLGSSNISSLDKLSTDQIKAELEELYFNEYIFRWNEFLKNIAYTNFGNIASASQNLQTLSDPLNSPIIQLLKIVAKETKFSSELSGAASTLAKVAQRKTKRITKGSLSTEMHPVDREFFNLHKFILGDPNKNILGEVESTLEQYSYIIGVLESIKYDELAVRNYTAQILKKGNGEFPSAKQSIEGKLFSIPILKKLLLEPIRLTWISLINETQDYINKQWKDNLYDSYRSTIAAYYPFNKEGMDLPFVDFEDFFNNQDGVFWTFINSELSDFVDLARMRPYRWENIGIEISEDFKSSIEKADDISKTLLKNGILNLSFELESQIPISKIIRGRKPIVEQITISIDGKNHIYKMGSPFWTDFIWPGRQGTSGAKLLVNVNDIGTVEKSFSGDWSLFKLLETAEIKKESSSRYQLIWKLFKENYYDLKIISRLKASGTKNPFQKKYFTTYKLPRKIN